MLLLYIVLLAVKFLWLDGEWCCSGAMLRIPSCVSIFTHTPVCVESPRKDSPGRRAFCLNIVRIRYLWMYLLPCICPVSSHKLHSISRVVSSSVQRCPERGAGAAGSPGAGTVLCERIPQASASVGHFLNQGMHHGSCLKNKSSNPVCFVY